MAWNLERGKKFKNILNILQTDPELKDADLYFFTEVDWGMVRSDNRNISAELGQALERYAYFAPSYYNLTKGHGVERESKGTNQLGLHGKSILSRYPLINLRNIALPNATDKLCSKEARLGQKRALLGDLKVGTQKITLACAHLDAFSSPRARARQLAEVVKACQNDHHALLAGDWNTNTLDSTSTPRLIFHVLYQILSVLSPSRMARKHYPYPHRRFDKPLFEMLEQSGFDYKECNEIGVETYDLLSNNQELGQMAMDQYPLWTLKWVNRLIDKAGGYIGLKLDWFATKNLQCSYRKVVKLKHSNGRDQASDHHPIVLDFKIRKTP